MSTAPSALIVEPEPSTGSQLASFLAQIGFRVAHAHSFLEAKTELTIGPHSLLITSIRLGEYNGLHLVLRARALQPHIPAIVIAPATDSVLEREAEALDAVYLVAPVAEPDFVAAVARTLAHRRDDPTPIRPPFERRRSERRTVTPGVFGGSERRQAERRVPVSRLVSDGLILS